MENIEVTNEKRIDSYFDGKVLDYIGWKLLSWLITFASLGIASPWGKCMLYKYQFNHTIYNGKRLKFEAYMVYINYHYFWNIWMVGTSKES